MICFIEVPFKDSDLLYRGAFIDSDLLYRGAFIDSDMLHRGCPLKTVICYIEVPL